MRYKLKTVSALCLAAIAACTTTPVTSGNAETLYTLSNATVLPSSNSDWDYIKFDPETNRLFIARRKDGLTVFDTTSNTVIATLENSVGANGPLILHDFNRGFVAMTDGSLLSFDLKTLEVIDRKMLATDGGLNGVVYDPASRRIHAVTGSRPEKATWFTLDPASGELLGTKVFPFRKMDDPAPDGEGHLYAPARYNNLLLKLDSNSLAEQDRWDINCDQVVAVEYQHHTDRLLIGCRGDSPVFIALDASTGAEIARIPIGKGIDGMAVDEERHRIITSNGWDATLTVIEQEGADSFRLLGNVQTRLQARVLQLDPESGDLFTVTADATFHAPGPDGTTPDPTFHQNTFTVLTYSHE